MLLNLNRRSGSATVGVMSSRLVFAGATAALLFALTACSAPTTDTAVPEPDTDTSASTEATEPAPDDATNGSAAESFTWDHLTSCEQIGAPVAQYTADLVLVENYFSEYEIQCEWEHPDPVEWVDVRTVSITLAQNSFVLTSEQLAMTESLVEHRDEALAAVGGVAYSMDMETAMTGVSATTVSVPGIDLTVSASEHASLPPLRDAAAVEVAKQLLRI